jgi:GGDEF domain-containing protein
MLVGRFRAEVDAANASGRLPFKLAVSAGLAAPVDGTEDLQVVIERADSAMYEDKQARRAREGSPPRS